MSYKHARENLSASVNPTATDDRSKGYFVGSKWVNVSSDESFICIDSTISAAIWNKTSHTAHDRLGFTFAPTSNGQFDALGWYETTDSAVVINSGSPATPTIPGYHSHYVLNVSAWSGGTVNVTFTGTSVDEVDGSTTSDTEIIAVTGTGFYQTIKSWITAPVISVTGGDTLTTDIIRASYWDRGNVDFTLTGLRLEWSPDQPSWAVDFDIIVVNDDGSQNIVDNVAFTQASSPARGANGETGKYKRGDYNTPVSGAVKEGIILRFNNQSGIGSIYVEAQYSDI